jgi:asparagine synthase (glutamine-hydrolysing)
MCGIVGVWSDGKPEQARAAVRDMMAASRHRGPDADGCIELPDSLVLGHTRLSILDLSQGARQPMCDSASGSWLIFNGEIYNFRDLRTQLESLGVSFATTGDSEVLLQALVHWGEAALDKIDGMFALAFWNGRERKLLLARDRLGIKPLYVYSKSRTLAFASEVKALEHANLGPLTLDRDAMDSFLAFGAVIGPNTIYREIRELEPGHVLRINRRGDVVDRQYWSLQSFIGESVTERHTRGAENFSNAVGEVRDRLTAAVDSHLVSDVPVGVFLSGGVDSSLLALLASERAKSPITLLTVAFAEQEFSELHYAKQIARDLPHHHEIVTLTGEQLRELLPLALSAMDQPTVDGINTYVISLAGASLGLKVLLSGIGGDELFGGYTTFAKAPKLLRFGAAIRPAARVIAKLDTRNPIQWQKTADAGRLQNLAEAYLLQRSIRWTQGSRRTLGARLQPNIDSLANDFQKLAALELEIYMGNQLLRDADVFSMANSVELRVPFLDLELLKTALAIEPRHHFDGGKGKRITWQILRELTKNSVSRRRKMGFAFPWQRWLQTSLQETISTTLRNQRLYEPLSLDPSYGQQLLAGLASGDRMQSWSEVWSLFVLLNWQARTGVECAVA